MMSQAKSQVQVSIVASMGQGFVQTFQAADKHVAGFRKTVADTNKIVSDVSAYRKQQDAVKQAGYSWQAAKAKADALRESIAAQGAPTRKQAADLAKLERATERAGAAFSKERAALAEMAAGLQKAGVNTGKLTEEQARLAAQLAKAQAAHDKAEASLKRQQAIVSGMHRMWGGIERAMIAGAAAGAVMGTAGRKALPYEEQIARLADTASANKGATEYAKAKTALSDAIQGAIDKTGGGSRDDFASALSILIGTGNLSTQEAIDALPKIGKAIFGGGMSGSDAASIYLRAKGMGIDGGRALEMTHRAGQLGGFESRDAAQYVPEQLASAKAAGYGGERGYAAIMAMNQVALDTAGNPAQAANNVTNLLNALSSQELSKNVSKTTKQEFDAYALKRAEAGVFKAEAFAEMADKKMMSDPKYRKLRDEAQKASGTDRGQIALQMADMMSGSVMGQLIQDRQARAAAMAMMFARKDKEKVNGVETNRSRLGSIFEDTLSSKDALGGSADRFKGETFASVGRLGEAVNRANEETFKLLSEPIKSLADGITKVAKEFPPLATAAYGAGLALLTIGGTGLLGNVFGRRPGAKVPGGPAGPAGPGAGPGGAVGAMGMLSRSAPLIGVAGLAGFTTAGEDKILADAGAQRQGIRDRYGAANVDAAFKAKKPWYIGHQDAASPKDLEGWVKSYMAEKDAAAKAAEAASKAAEAAQNRPNVTMSNSYSITVQSAPDAAYTANQIMNQIKLFDKQRAAESRSLMFDKKGF